MVKEQYAKECYRMINRFGVKFASDNDSDDPGIGIQVLDPEELKENGWDFFFENSSEDNKVIIKSSE